MATATRTRPAVEPATAPPDDAAEQPQDPAVAEQAPDEEQHDAPVVGPDLTTTSEVSDLLNAPPRFLPKDSEVQPDEVRLPAPEEIASLGFVRVMSIAEYAARMAHLRSPFPTSWIEKLPKPLKTKDGDKGKCEEGGRTRGEGKIVSSDGYYCGGWHARSIHLDYVGAAGIIMRLNEVDPFWHDEPLVRTPDGTPATRLDGTWWKVTVLGKTVEGFGDAEGKSGANAMKELRGDAIRQCAKYLGVATYLWAKSDYAAALKTDDGSGASHPGDDDVTFQRSGPRHQAPAPLPDAETVAAELIEAVDAADPVAAIIAVGNKYGKGPLSQVSMTTDGGAKMTLDDYIERLIDWARKRAAGQSVGDEQVPPGDADQPTERTATPAPAAPPAEDKAAAARRALAEAEEAAAHSERERVAQQRPGAPVTTGEQRQRAAILDEVVGQARTMGVHPNEHVVPLLAQRGVESVENVPTPILKGWVLSQRQTVIDRLIEQGMATMAQTYTDAMHAKTIHRWAVLTGDDEDGAPVPA